MTEVSYRAALEALVAGSEYNTHNLYDEQIFAIKKRCKENNIPYFTVGDILVEWLDKTNPCPSAEEVAKQYGTMLATQKQNEDAAASTIEEPQPA